MKRRKARRPRRYSPMMLLTVNYQRGKSNISADRKRKARLPGKRRSKSGRKYWETRKNRSDKRGMRV